MINVGMIEKAIAAHARWKARLRAAVDSGKFDMTPAAIKLDDQCDFGKWLYSPEFSAAEKQTANYRNAMGLHAAFHREAAKVVESATSGHKDVAEEAIGLHGGYTKASSDLTKELTQWRLTLG
ncbi:MAG: CZB domain-containing protein [Terriglobales bacterium]